MRIQPLGIVAECLQEAGREITHVYEDLVFVNHNAYILQFTEEANRVKILVNTEAEETDALYEEISRIRNAGIDREIEIILGGHYSLKEAGEENLEVVLLQ